MSDVVLKNKTKRRPVGTKQTFLNTRVMTTPTYDVMKIYL